VQSTLINGTYVVEGRGAGIKNWQVWTMRENVRVSGSASGVSGSEGVGVE